MKLSPFTFSFLFFFQDLPQGLVHGPPAGRDLGPRRTLPQNDLQSADLGQEQPVDLDLRKPRDLEQQRLRTLRALAALEVRGQGLPPEPHGQGQPGLCPRRRGAEYSRGNPGSK